MSKISMEDITGQQFGRLTALKRVFGYKKTSWLCRCTCGIEKVMFLCDLKRGYRNSCGCSRATRGDITFNGVTKSVPEWAKSLGMRNAILYARLRRLPVEQALNLDYRPRLAGSLISEMAVDKAFKLVMRACIRHACSTHQIQSGV